MQFKDYYAVLGVARDAPADEIRKAFRKLARKYHPDVSKVADAEARMKEVNEAYAVLSDPEKRTAYDRLGQGYRPGQEFRPPPDWNAGFEFSGHGFSADETAGFSDFFEQIFGRAGFAGGAGFHRQARGFGSGQDQHARVLLDIEDAFSGANRQLSLQIPQLDAQGRLSRVTRTLNVRIPKGVKEGQLIRLAGQGAPGAGGDRAGDLLLEVQFRPHPRFRAVGRDLHLTLPVAPWEAALGAVIPVELPGGAVKVRLPHGTQGGMTVRVRGRGIPGEPPGDLLLEVKVVLPPAETPRAREFYARMASELAFNPRSPGA